jgi:hypothetical protein
MSEGTVDRPEERWREYEWRLARDGGGAVRGGRTALFLAALRSWWSGLRACRHEPIRIALPKADPSSISVSKRSRGKQSAPTPANRSGRGG